MTPTNTNPFEALERLFHEPGRLAIMSALCAAGEGLPFTDLKESCSLTDGNLSRHLKMLQDAGAIRLEKSFVGLKPRTTVFLTQAGIESFHQYLEVLEAVLERARSALPASVAAPVAHPVLKRRHA